jgi:hypothetical protein
MPEASANPKQHDLDDAIRLRILVRAASINTKLVSRLMTVGKDLEEGSVRDALSCLGGLERRIYAIRNLLILTLGA